MIMNISIVCIFLGIVGVEIYRDVEIKYYIVLMCDIYFFCIVWCVL